MRFLGMPKKGFFFSLDAFFALILFGLFLSLIYTSFFSAPRIEQPFYVSEDVLDVLSNVRIKELDLSQYPGIMSLITTGVVTNTDKTVFEVLVELNQKVPPDTANTKVLMDDLMKGVVPVQYGLGLDLKGQQVYANDPAKEATNVIARQRLVLG